MNCTDFEAALEQHLETRNPLDSAAIEHVSACPECRVELQIQQQMNAAIVTWRPVEVFAGLVDQVLAELAMPSLTKDEDEQAVGSGQWAKSDDHWGTNSVRIAPIARASTPRGRSAVLMAAAACLIIAVVFLAPIRGRNPVELARETQTPVRESVIAQTPLEVSQTLSEVFSDLRSEYREMASETKSVAMDLVNGLPHRIEMPLQPAPEEFVPRPTSSDVSRIWRPIGSRVETALGFLWQAVPSEVPSG